MSGPPMQMKLIPVCGDLKRIKEIWESLEEDADNSYFLSWGWIENWLNSLPDHAKPELAVFGEGEDLRLAFFLGKATLTRTTPQVELYGQKHLFKSRGLFLNATGIPACDRIEAEYNGFLYKRGEGLRLLDILPHLPDPWDELYLPGLDMRSLPGAEALDQIPSFKTIIKDDMIVLSPFVDLDLVRERAGDYLSLLSANTRSQVRRSYLFYEAIAPVQLEVAQDIRSAMDIYRELVGLHEASWLKRKQEGAFASNYMLQFHQQLIESRFANNEIQLMRIKCANNTIGCLYNFVYKNKVYFYQSGINYNSDKRLKPGLVSHVEAIRYNATAGYKTYDFLGGGSRYKMSLATHHNRLIWIRLQKRLAKFSFENGLKKLKHLFTGLGKNANHPFPGSSTPFRFQGE